MLPQASVKLHGKGLTPDICPLRLRGQLDELLHPHHHQGGPRRFHSADGSRLPPVAGAQGSRAYSIAHRAESRRAVRSFAAARRRGQADYEGGHDSFARQQGLLSARAVYRRHVRADSHFGDSFRRRTQHPGVHRGRRHDRPHPFDDAAYRSERRRAVHPGDFGDWECTAWRSPDGRPTTSILCSAVCAVRHR